MLAAFIVLCFAVVVSAVVPHPPRAWLTVVLVAVAAVIALLYRSWG